MRLVIDHCTRYRFTVPQARVVQLLRMTPSHTENQSVVEWRINVDCDARLKAGRDGLGNCTTMLYIDGPVEAIELTVAGEVFTEPNEGLLSDDDEPFPPLLFTRSTPITAADATIAALAGEADRGGDLEARALALARVVAQRTTRTAGLPDPARTAAGTLTEGSGTSRDLAHLLVAVARARGIAARYVSGHCFSETHAHSRSAHSWAELHIGERGWLALDPSTGLPTDENYARVAVGLDASYAMPASGTRMGGGQEELAVDVHVGERTHEEPGR